jgi:hypothetical protein
VRATTRPLVENAEYVSINDDQVAAYADQLAAQEIDIPPWSWDGYPSMDWSHEERLQEIALSCMNAFCFGDLDGDGEYATAAQLPDDDEPQTYTRSDGNWAAFKRGHTDERYPDFLDADELEDLSYDPETPEESDVYRFFDPKDDQHTIPMLQQRHELLQDAGAVLNAKYDGQFANVWEQAGHQLFDDGNGFIERLVNDFAGFADSWQTAYGEAQFNKKAQLTASIAYGHFQFDDYFAIDDREKQAMTVFADYRLPQQFAHPAVDILEYEPALAERIADADQLPAGSQEELEIRAATIHAGDRVLDAVNERRDEEIGVPELDFLLWTAGRDIDDTRHHLTATTAY